MNTMHPSTDKKTLIKNGTVVTPGGVIDADILIQGETIAQIRHRDQGRNPAADATAINAQGLIVIPGGIDVHTHFNLDVGIAVAQDDFYTGTVAAAMGGTTTIVDHPGFGPENCSLFHQIEKYHGFAQGNAVIDYSFHGVLQHLNQEVLRDIPRLADQGITSMKAYMTYGHMFSADMLAQLFDVTQKSGVLIAVHAEDDTMINRLRREFQEAGKRDAIYHALSRPNETEAKAVREVIDIAAVNDAPLYIVHLTTRQGLEAVKAARQSGRSVFAETCPQYLFLDEDAYREEDHGGLKYVMSPPLRSKKDQAALWQGLRDETISTVGTDHCPFDFKLKKQLAKDDFTRCPGGAPGVESRIPLMFSGLVKNLETDLVRFCRLVSENPARIMGLYPKKGIIKEGSDADIVLMDPRKKTTISHEMLHENVDYTPYEGIRVDCWPVLTMVRGEVVVKNGVFTGQKGFGRFIKRKQSEYNL